MPESLQGGWSPIEADEDLNCPVCHKTVRGGIGPRGGKKWSWKLPDGTRYCSRECAKQRLNEEDAADVNAEGAFDAWMREQEIEA